MRFATKEKKTMNNAGKIWTWTLKARSVSRTCLVVMLVATWVVGLINVSVADPKAEPLVPQAEMLKFLVEPDTFTLVDARSSEEFATGHVSGAINVPHDRVAAFVDQLPANPDAPLVLYCRTGHRAKLLQQQLLARGYRNVRTLHGQQIFWGDGLAVFNCSATAALESEAAGLAKLEGNPR